MHWPLGRRKRHPECNELGQASTAPGQALPRPNSKSLVGPNHRSVAVAIRVSKDEEFLSWPSGSSSSRAYRGTSRVMDQVGRWAHIHEMTSRAVDSHFIQSSNQAARRDTPHSVAY